MLEFMLTQLAALASALLSVLVSAGLQDPIQDLLARLFGGGAPYRGPRLVGLWRSTYRYVSGQKRHAVQIMRIWQVGPYVIGKCRATSCRHMHFIKARAAGPILTGVWRNTVPGAHHEGTFQLVISPDGASMSGKWIGFDHRQRIQHGEWHWQLLARDHRQVEPSGALESFAPSNST